MRALRSVAIAAALFAPATLAAQLAPDAPRLISPHGSGGFGVHWLSPGTLPGDDESFIATWAMPGLQRGLRLRGGFGRGAGRTNAGFGGIDLQSKLLRGSRDLPFDLDWQAGIGVGVGEYVLVSVPIGLSGGVAWRSESFWMSPYVNAGITADMRLGTEAPERSMDVSPALDVGLDLSFDAERRFMLRTAASLGDRQAVSLGFALGVGRP